jgi:hypothetical protein
MKTLFVVGGYTLLVVLVLIFDRWRRVRHIRAMVAEQEAKREQTLRRLVGSYSEGSSALRRGRYLTEEQAKHDRESVLH